MRFKAEGWNLFWSIDLATCCVFFSAAKFLKAKDSAALKAHIRRGNTPKLDDEEIRDPKLACKLLCKCNSIIHEIFFTQTAW